MNGHQGVKMTLGDFQPALPRRATKLLNKGCQWYFILILDLPDAVSFNGVVFSVLILERTISLRPPTEKYLEEVNSDTFRIGIWRFGAAFSPTAANQQGNC
jgi:hypothetical protein